MQAIHPTAGQTGPGSAISIPGICVIYPQTSVRAKDRAQNNKRPSKRRQPTGARNNKAGGRTLALLPERRAEQWRSEKERTSVRAKGRARNDKRPSKLCPPTGARNNIPGGRTPAILSERRVASWRSEKARTSVRVKGRAQNNERP